MKKRWGKKYKDKRKWKEYNKQLIKRGEFYVNPRFLNTWNEEIKETNHGKEEIVVTAVNNFAFVEAMILDLETGQLLNRWRVSTGYYLQNPSLGDLDKDGRKEIIYADVENIYVADALSGAMRVGFPRHIWDGEPRLPIPPEACYEQEAPYCYPTQLGVADLDGDGYPDIYTEAIYNFRDPSDPNGYMYSIFAYDRVGNTLSGFPFHLRNFQVMPWGIGSWSERYPFTYADINTDGIADMVGSKGWGRIEAFRLNSPYNKKLAPFPKYGVDEQNTKEIRD